MIDRIAVVIPCEECDAIDVRVPGGMKSLTDAEGVVVENTVICGECGEELAWSSE